MKTNTQPGNRYLNPLTDFGFKLNFGDKEIMTAFLTDLLEPASPIAEITFLDKEMLGEQEEQGRNIYDLRCKTEDGKEFIVEMQNKSQSFFSDRILFYLSRSISEQGTVGINEWKYDIHPVYCICFLNFSLTGLKPSTIRTVQMEVEETGEVFTDKVRAYILEVKDYKNKREEDCVTKIDYWLYNLCNMENMTGQVPFQDKQPAFKKMSKLSELSNMSRDDIMKYFGSLKAYRDELACLDYARLEGVAEGRAEGRAEVIESMRKSGMSEEEIQRILSLC